MDKIGIIGTGMIGTSLGLALKAARVKAQIVGHDRDYGNASKAQKRGAIDKATRSIRETVEDAGLVIVATPVGAIADVFDLIAGDLREDCVVTDTGSTKVEILKWAEEILPKSVSFVGGHPMAGKEASGPDAAEATLFQGRSYCIIPGRGSKAEAVEMVVQLARSVGAIPRFMDGGEHDSFVAAVSHLPMILSVALVACTSKSPSWEDIAQVAATGYRDITRLASGDPTMHRDICRTNPQLIAHWIDTFIQELKLMRETIVDAERGKALEEMFSNAKVVRQLWLDGKIKPGSKALSYPQVASFGEQMGELFLGRKVMEAQKRMFERFERRDGDDKKRRDSKSSSS